MKTTDENFPWYVVYAKPHQEKLAQENLERQDFQTLLPTIKVVKLVRQKWQEKFEPMFPRYIFFQPTRAQQSLHSVRSTLGVHRLVRFGDTPASLTPASMENLLLMIETHNGEDYTQLTPLQPGKEVEVHHGAFVGQRGLVSAVSAERVWVLLEILGKRQEIAFEPSALRVFNA